jgi:hypothetical protein
MGIRETFLANRRRETEDEVVELTNQFYVTLRAYFAEIRKDGDGQIRNREAFNRVKALLEPADGNQNWTNAYEVEQLLVHLFDDDTVATELTVRTLEARSVLHTDLAAMYDAHAHEIDNPPAGQATDPAIAALRRRALLARLVNDLQWRYIVNEATRRYSKAITRRTAILSVFALMIFVAAVVLIVMRTTTFYFGDLRLLGVAALAGTWGATFSMLATLKSRLDGSKFDDLKLMRALSVLLSRAAIGAGAASILFFFLLSGLLGGSAFPSLARARDDAGRVTTSAAPADSSAAQSSPPTAAGTNAGRTQEPLPATELALLIVWCFIAGFSEQLIPSLLASTEARATSPAAAGSDRFRPTSGTTAVPAPPGSAMAAPPQPAQPLPVPRPSSAPDPVPAGKPQGEPAGV